MQFQILEISRIVEDSEQPRKALDDAALAGLADSIRQYGILNPITVEPLSGVDAFRIVTGERRWRAAQIAGLTEMPCIVREATAQDAAEKTAEQLIENLQREELTPLDKANAFKALKEQLGATNKELGQRLGVSERTVGYLLDLLDLPESIGEQIVSSPNRPADGNLTEKHGRFLRQLNDQPDLQAHLVEKIRGEKLSADDTGKIAKALRSNPDKQAEIMAATIETLPEVLGSKGSLSDDAPAFSTGRAYVGYFERMLAMFDEIRISSVSGAELSAVEEAAAKVKGAVDKVLAEVRAARNLG
jgi:ParB family transcriptional regulator, chromosome partitioning protein